MEISGQSYTRKELMSKIGDISQIGGVKKFELMDGKAQGTTAIEINCGNGFVFTVLPDRGMDIAQASFMGEGMSWISKNGITAPQFYDNNGLQWLRGFYGGLVTTCGLRQVGAPSNVDGEDFGLHGRIANTPATNVSIDAGWVGDDYIMKVSGEMRESIVFGENISLKRIITAKMGEKRLFIHDTITNEGFNTEQILQLYHCNFGFPVIDEGSEIKVPRGKITPVTPNAEEGLSTMSILHKPTNKYQEQCFFIDFDDDSVCVEIENTKLKNSNGIYIKFNKKQLPAFTIWKMMGEGDYVVGLEPGICVPMGREKALNKGLTLELPPFSEYVCDLEIGVK